jgi:hypothetical protein
MTRKLLAGPPLHGSRRGRQQAGVGDIGGEACARRALRTALRAGVTSDAASLLHRAGSAAHRALANMWIAAVPNRAGRRS